MQALYCKSSTGEYASFAVQKNTGKYVFPSFVVQSSTGKDVSASFVKGSLEVYTSL